MLLVGIVIPVSAQTSTPTSGVSTGAPGATATMFDNPGGHISHFSFLTTQAFFGFTDGAWVSGVGFQSDGGVLNMLGEFQMSSVNRVVLYYNSDVSGSYALNVEDTVSTPVFEGGGIFSACDDGCAINQTVDEASGDTMRIDITVSSDTFTLYAMDVYYGPGGDEYVVEGDCPVLSDEQIGRLDPSYFASCSACFTEPTAVREKPIPQITVVGSGTPDLSTFQIPVIVSGTPVTATPVVGLPGGGLFTPTASALPSSTPFSTPGQLEVYYDFRASAAGAVVVPYSFGLPSPAPYTGMYVSGLGFKTFFQANFDGFGDDGEFLQIQVASGQSTPVDHFALYGSEDAVAYYQGLETGRINPSFTGSGGGRGDFLFVFSGDTDISDGYFIMTYLANGRSGYIQGLALVFNTSATATPFPTYTPVSTGAPWLTLPATEAVDCAVAFFRDNSPIASFPDVLTTIDYQCYQLVPEIHVGVPDHSLDVEGVQLCVTWFEMPLISLLGITFTLDIVLVAVAAFLARLLLRL